MGLEFLAPCDSVPPQLGVWSAAYTALKIGILLIF